MLTVLADFRTEQLGESALVIDAGPDAASLSAHLESLELSGVVDVVPAFDKVAVYFDSVEADTGQFRQILADFVPTVSRLGKHHVVPVCYVQGEDLGQVLAELSLSFEELVALHSGRTYDCKAIGFCPGFPYLGWLDDKISGLGRLESPRLRVAPGSVAIVGRMTGVYPLLRPGGWRLVGRTPLTLVDPDDSYFPIKVGDSVEFRPINEADFGALVGERL